MKKKGKRLRSAVGVLLAATVVTAFPAYADEKAEAESRKAEYEAMRESLEAQKEDLQDDWKALQKYTQKIDGKLTDASTKIYELENQIADSTKQIGELEDRLKEQETEIAKRYDDMSLRIQFMYEKGNQQFLALLLSADSFKDFLNKAEYVTQITSYDRKMLDQLEELKNQIETSQQELISGKEKLERMKSEQEEKQEELQELLAEKEAELAKTETDIDQKDSQINQAVLNIQEEDAYLKEIEAMERRRKEAEAKKKAEKESLEAAQASKEAEEASRREEDSKNAAQSVGEPEGGNKTKPLQTTTKPASDSGKDNAGTSDSNINTDEESFIGDGTYIWPLPPQYHRRSSTYGYRPDPWGSGEIVYHCGDDYPAPAGTPIYAVADGTVDFAGYTSSTGNCVNLYHGDGLSSIYMHASVLLCKTGDIVKQGDVIALVGTTGPSTGNHLHISFRLNGEWVDPKNYIGE